MTREPFKLTPGKVANDLALLAFLAIAITMFWPTAQSKAPADFMNFWAGSRALLTGANPYDKATLMALQHTQGTDYNALLLLNPPPFLLLIWPLSLMPAVVAVAVWSLTTFIAFWLVARQLAPKSQWLIALFPAAYWTATTGQTGFLVSALLIGAALSFDRRPRLSGVLVGLLIIKPHFAVLMPFLLYRKWPAFLSAAITVVVLLGAAELVFPGMTALYLQQDVSGALQERPFLLRIVHSVFVGSLALGLPTPVAAGLQVVSALAALAATIVAARSERPTLEKFAVALAATPLVIPYLYDYDLPFLILPIVVIARRRLWLAAALYLMPTFAMALVPIPLHQLAFAVMVAVLMWDGRAVQTREAASTLPTEPEPQPAAS